VDHDADGQPERQRGLGLQADVNGDTTPEVEIHLHTMTAQFFNDDITL
jgi:hypothetical protein